jgi:hypothetical protein
MAENPTTARGRYEQLATQRSPFLQRGRDAAKVTIPALLPETDGPSGAKQLYTPFQSVGARGVNNLASKLLLALLPPGDPFFRLAVDDFLLAELAEAAGETDGDPRQLFEEALNAVERAIMTRLEQLQIRPGMFETLKQLIATGNALLQIRPGRKGARMYRLDQYVCKRDPSGTPLEIIVKQELSPAAAPPEVLQVVDRNKQQEPRNTEQTIPLFTWIKRGESLWEIRQEAEDMLVPGSEGTEPLDRSSWLPLRFTRIDSEDYGRGHVEEYIGDLISLEALSQALVEGAAAAAKTLAMVRPGGVTTRSQIEQADNLDVIEGEADDVSFLQVEKFADFTVAQRVADGIERRLSAVFLLSSGLPRDAERVTAEEIRLIATELEDILGGTYSLFSEELQLPLVRKLMGDMSTQGDLPSLPKDKIEPQIVTGLEALGRNRDLQKLDTLVGGVAQIFPPEQVSQYVNIGSYIRRRGVALGIDLDGVIRSDEEVQQMQEAAQQQALAERVGPDVVKQIGSAQQQAEPPQ